MACPIPPTAPVTSNTIFQDGSHLSWLLLQRLSRFRWSASPLFHAEITVSITFLFRSMAYFREGRAKAFS